MVYHVKREANGAAHALAKSDFFGISEQVWLEEIPPCIFLYCFHRARLSVCLELSLCMGLHRALCSFCLELLGSICFILYEWNDIIRFSKRKNEA